MQRSRPRVVIEVSPSRLELGVVRRGTVAQARIVRAEKPDWGGTWPDSLASLSKTLAQWCTELDLSGSPVTLIYTVPSTVVGVFACPTAAGPTAADHAALLALSGLAGFDVAEAPSGVRRLTTDREAAPSSVQNPTPQRQAHTLAAADREDTSTMLSGWLSGAGLVPERFIPASAIQVAHATSTLHEADTCTATLFIGEHESVLCAGDKRRLRFVRTLGLGLETFVDALMRSARIRLPDGQVAEMTRDRAREILVTFGIPEAGTDTAPTPGGSAGAEAPPLLPLLTPILQRLASELKQSVRFGFTEPERQGLTVTVLGPGALVPRLGDALAAQAGLTPGLPGAAADIKPDSLVGAVNSSECGPIGLWLVSDKTGINLAPQMMREAHRFGRVRAAAWVGMVAAIAFVGYQALATRMDLAQARSEQSVALQNGQQAEQDLALRTMANAAVAARAAVQQRLAEQMGSTTDWTALLNTLAQLTPDSIRLAQIDFDVTERGPEARITGSTPSGDPASSTTDGAEPARRIRAYSETLSLLPIVSGVRMGATSRAQSETGDVWRFEFTVQLIPLPALTLQDYARSQTADAQPLPANNTTTASAAPTDKGNTR